MSREEEKMVMWGVIRDLSEEGIEEEAKEIRKCIPSWLSKHESEE